VPEDESPDIQISRSRLGKLSGETDRSLVLQVLRGSRPAAEELAGRYWEEAYRTAYAVLRDPVGAEDVAQESMLAAFAALDRFRAVRPFAPWLHRITVNRAIDWQRANRRRRETPEA
jgi:DNA-directed RNA polymerase specialized sigma24 family protein